MSRKPTPKKPTARARKRGRSPSPRGGPITSPVNSTEGAL